MMFFTFSTFTKINIVVEVSAAGRISVGRNLPRHMHYFFFFFLNLQPNEVFFFPFGYSYI